MKKLIAALLSAAVTLGAAPAAAYAGDNPSEKTAEVDGVTYTYTIEDSDPAGITLMSTSEIVGTLTMPAEIYGHKVIFVDYGQLIQTDSERGVPRAEKLARVSQYLKIAARETDTLVVLLLQLKQPERYKTNDGCVRTLSPTMEDLGESRQWMKDADVIFILSRPDGSENSGDEDGEKLSYDRHRYLKVAKNKEGKRGTMTLTFDGLHQSFYPKGQEPDARKPSDRKKQPAGHPGQITFTEQQETGDEPF